MPGSHAGSSRRLLMAFHIWNCVSTQADWSFAAQWLACALPCRRFAGALAGVCARLGADVDRYSLNVRDLHPLLLAGLPAHSKNQHTSRHMHCSKRFSLPSAAGPQLSVLAPSPTFSHFGQGPAAWSWPPANHKSQGLR
jgi:hypothetical protein